MGDKRGNGSKQGEGEERKEIKKQTNTNANKEAKGSVYKQVKNDLLHYSDQ